MPAVKLVSEDTREYIRCYITSANQPHILMTFLMGLASEIKP
jgi:hypothetical protein